jgi:hypothetical protein
MDRCKCVLCLKHNRTSSSLSAFFHLFDILTLLRTLYLCQQTHVEDQAPAGTRARLCLGRSAGGLNSIEVARTASARSAARAAATWANNEERNACRRGPKTVNTRCSNLQSSKLGLASSHGLTTHTSPETRVWR